MTSTSASGHNTVVAATTTNNPSSSTTTTNTVRVPRTGGLLDKCAIVVAKNFQEDTKQYLSDELLTRVQKHMTKEAQIRYLGMYKCWFSNNLLFKYNTYNPKTGTHTFHSIVFDFSFVAASPSTH